MPTVSIGTAGGRTYASLSAFAAWVNTQSLTADVIAEVYNDGEIVEAAAVTLGGWTANGFSVIVRPAAGAGFKDNANAATSALRYSAANGAAIKSTYSPGAQTPACFSLTGTNLQVRGMQFMRAGTDNITRTMRVTTASAGVVIEDCIIAANGTAVALQLDTATTVRNCIVHGRDWYTSASPVGILIDGPGTLVENCLVVATAGASGATGIYASSGAPTVKNTAMIGFGAGASGGSFNAASTNNATSGGSWANANLGQAGQVNLAAADFVSLTNTTEDFRVAAGSTKLIGTGATLGTVTADILGTARSAPYEIGPFEVPPVAAVLSGDVPLAPVVAAGSGGSSASDLAGDVPLNAAVAAGTLGQAPGVLTLGPVHAPQTGVRADGATLPWVSVHRLSDGLQVVVLTTQTVNASGNLVLTHGSITPGVAYAGLLYDGTVAGCGLATAA